MQNNFYDRKLLYKIVHVVIFNRIIIIFWINFSFHFFLRSLLHCWLLHKILCVCIGYILFLMSASHFYHKIHREISNKRNGISPVKKMFLLWIGKFIVPSYGISEHAHNLHSICTMQKYKQKKKLNNKSLFNTHNFCVCFFFFLPIILLFAMQNFFPSFFCSCVWAICTALCPCITISHLLLSNRFHFNFFKVTFV